MNRTRKAIITIASLLFACGSLFAAPIKIDQVTVNSLGKTKEKIFLQNFFINKNKIFNSVEEFESYLSELEQDIKNKRLFENIVIEYKLSEPAEDQKTTDSISEDSALEITSESVEENQKPLLAHITITFSDSLHTLALPKPSYDSNSGAELKIKLKDTNFLGLMNTFNADINIKAGTEEAPTDFTKIGFGTNLSYDFPFLAGKTKNVWTNDFSFSWQIGDASPEYSYATGLTIGIPLSTIVTLNVNFTQALTENFDYKDYGDDFYFTEQASLSVPVTLYRINNIVPVSYTPSINFVYYWDKDKINLENKDLYSPELTFQNYISVNNSNWIENFRDGFSANARQYIGLNLMNSTGGNPMGFVSYFSLQGQFYKQFKYLGINTNASFYWHYNKTEDLGGQLRGIINNQRYYESDDYALKSENAIVFNIEVPVHIVTTHWLEWEEKIFGPYENYSKAAKAIMKYPNKLLGLCDFELQVSPFFDMALMKNSSTGRLFNFKDGFYSAGFEILVYPSRFKSYVVRLSYGIDAGRKLFGSWIDTSWRDNNAASREIFFGLGHSF